MPPWLLITLSSLGYLLIGWAVFVVHAAKYPYRVGGKSVGWIFLVPIWPLTLVFWGVLCMVYFPLRTSIDLTNWAIKKLNPAIKDEWR